MSARFQLWLGHPLTEKIREHGEATYPHECCGALLGHDAELAKADGASEETRRVVSLLPLSNRNGDSPRKRWHANRTSRLSAGTIPTRTIRQNPANLTACTPGRGTATSSYRCSEVSRVR